MKKLLVSLLAVAMVFAMTACGGSGGGGDSSEGPIRIGFFAPVSAPAASADGTSSLNSAKLAVEICNANGGINGREVELVDFDEAMAKAPKAAKKTRRAGKKAAAPAAEAPKAEVAEEAPKAEAPAEEAPKAEEAPATEEKAAEEPKAE